MKVNRRQYDLLSQYLALALSEQERLPEKDRLRLNRIKKKVEALKPIDGEDQHWCVGIARALKTFN